MRWNDNWGGASKDLDIILVKNPGASETRITGLGGKDRQQGGGADVPREYMRFTATAAATYGLLVEQVSGSRPSRIQLQARSTLPHSTARHSIESPAGSNHAGMLAVGAATTTTGNIHSYSSRGPTPDGRIKPDIVGAAGYQTRSGTVSGTSITAPHVAGLAALVAQQHPQATPSQIASYLKNHAYSRIVGIPDNTWGHGFARLPSLTCHDALTKGGALTGHWTDDCTGPYNGTRSIHYYTFRLDQPRTVTIDLASSADNYLYLRQGFNTQLAPPLFQDNNSGDGKNARSSQSLAAGLYTIEATTLHRNQRGANAGLPAHPEWLAHVLDQARGQRRGRK